MSELKIEVGKFYVNKIGQKVIIYAIDCDCDKDIHGAVSPDGKYWYIKKWSKDGTHSDSSYNIIGEWVEPKPKKRAWISDLGEVAFSTGDSFFYTYGQGKLYSCRGILSTKWERAPWLDEK